MRKQRRFKNKSVSAVSVIGGADGPTAVFVAQKDEKKKSKKRLRSLSSPKKTATNPHTLKETVRYAIKRWGYTLVSRDSEEYRNQWREMRASLILQHKPELLGELEEEPKLENYSEKSLNEFWKKISQREEAAAEVPEEDFKIDLCVLKKTRRNYESILLFERKYKYIGGSASGSRWDIRRYNKTFLDIERYYGAEHN